MLRCLFGSKESRVRPEEERANLERLKAEISTLQKVVQYDSYLDILRISIHN